MPATYEKCGKDVQAIVDRMMKNFHQDRLGLKDLRVGCIFYIPLKRDPGLRLHGYKCAAVIKAVSLKNRAMGLPDAEITIDQPTWSNLIDEEKNALIDHELEHLDVIRKKGVVRYDELMRPRLRLKLHDWELGGFRVIAERHGEHSFDVKNAQAFASKHGQLLFPFAAKSPRQKAEEFLNPAAELANDPKFAKAVKGLIPRKGESISFESGGQAVTIDDSNRERIKENCNAVIRGGRRAASRG